MRITLVLNQRQAAPGGWKSLLEFTAAINRELENAGIYPSSLSDKELEEEIQTLLQGGSILSKPLPAGIGSVWRTLANAINLWAKHIWQDARNGDYLPAAILVMTIISIHITIIAPILYT